MALIQLAQILMDIPLHMVIILGAASAGVSIIMWYLDPAKRKLMLFCSVITLLVQLAFLLYATACHWNVNNPGGLVMFAMILAQSCVVHQVLLTGYWRVTLTWKYSAGALFAVAFTAVIWSVVIHKISTTI